MHKPKVWDFLPGFTRELEMQLRSDYKRWGDEWLERPRTDQETRIFLRIEQYYSEWLHEGVKMPWLKIAGLVVIGWVRDNYPWLSKNW